MLSQKLNILALSCIAALIVSACNPYAVKPGQDKNNLNNPDNILNLLDPDVKTEEQAFAKAEAALSEGQSENALFYYIKTLQFNNKNIQALEHIAAIHSRNKHPELALKIYQDILAIDSKNLFANENLGLYLLANGQIGKAKEHLTAAVTKSNSSWKAHNGLGVIADLANNSSEAIAHYQAALAMQPTDPMILNNLGYSYYLSGDKTKAKFYFNQALNFDNRYDRAIHNLALLEIQNGNFSTAVALFNRIMPAYESYNNIGYICMLNGQHDMADEYLNRAINESPVYFPKAQENLKTLSTLTPRHTLPRQMLPFEPESDAPSTPAQAKRPAT
ncbi:MAG: tetratricopeptide repeat protein [Methylococcales bacterium]|nr:tetratricopeptide repeat protein [Methylococcales bacterium]MDD5630663.1 tetratricopeptide repeat protein [Methylococcales bacterium]